MLLAGGGLATLLLIIVGWSLFGRFSAPVPLATGASNSVATKGSVRFYGISYLDGPEEVVFQRAVAKLPGALPQTLIYHPQQNPPSQNPDPRYRYRTYLFYVTVRPDQRLVSEFKEALKSEGAFLTFADFQVGNQKVAIVPNGFPPEDPVSIAPRQSPPSVQAYGTLIVFPMTYTGADYEGSLRKVLIGLSEVVPESIVINESERRCECYVTAYVNSSLVEHRLYAAGFPEASVTMASQKVLLTIDASGVNPPLSIPDLLRAKIAGQIKFWGYNRGPGGENKAVLNGVSKLAGAWVPSLDFGGLPGKGALRQYRFYVTSTPSNEMLDQLRTQLKGEGFDVQDASFEAFEAESSLEEGKNRFYSGVDPEPPITP